MQALVDQTPEGGKLHIPSGSYTGPLVITKPMELSVESGGTAVLHHSGEEPALLIEADEVIVTHLQIHDLALKEAATVAIQGNGAVLDHLQIHTATTAIRIQNASHAEVRDSTIVWSGEPDTNIFSRGNGIALYHAHEARLIDNDIQGMRDGIYLENSNNTIVTGNRIAHSRYGVHCMYTEGTVIRGNTGIQNITGAMVMVVRDAQVIGNMFAKQDENVNAQGILLYDVQDTLVQDNVVEGNRVGIYVDQSIGNYIVDNRILVNFIGLQLMKSDGNVISGNAFIGNVSDAQARDSANPELSGNYWDTFKGIDMDGDGKSDLGYTIHPFFAHLVQQRPAFQLFFQSPGMQFLESMVQPDPSLWIGDPSPLLSPPTSALSVHNASNRVTGISGFLLLSCSSMFILWCRRKKQ